MSLRADDIRFSYGPRFALRVEAFEANGGEFVGVIGANGCGKTTLLKILSGLVPPTAGSVLLDGEPLERYSPNHRARRIAYAPQSYRPAFEFTVEQTVLLGRMPYRSSYRGFERDEDLRAAEEAIELMDLVSLRYEPITDLSGGELQRVMIAKALAQQTNILLLDEPNSHLDIAHQQRMLEIVRGLTRSRGFCVIASIHDLNLASIFSDRIIAMASGEIVAHGTPAEVLRRDILLKTFGADLEVESNIYGNAPAIRYRYRGEEVLNG
jgi:iron complex transport system ATP-binding protein